MTGGDFYSCRTYSLLWVISMFTQLGFTLNNHRAMVIGMAATAIADAACSNIVFKVAICCASTAMTTPTHATTPIKTIANTQLLRLADATAARTRCALTAPGPKHACLSTCICKA